LKIEFIGHSTFVIYLSSKILLFDPFIKNNPFVSKKISDIYADYILLSHGHDDHLGDTIKIAKKNKANVLAPFELGMYLKNKCKNITKLDLGGELEFDFGKIKMVKAVHSSSIIKKTIFNTNKIIYAGNACGYLINTEGKTIYYSGDTAVFKDMELIKNSTVSGIDIAIISIGGRYTMGPDDALRAIDMLSPKKIIPMHYNTFPAISIKTDQLFKEIKDRNIELLDMRPGQTIEVIDSM